MKLTPDRRVNLSLHVMDADLVRDAIGSRLAHGQHLDDDTRASLRRLADVLDERTAQARQRIAAARGGGG